MPKKRSKFDLSVHYARRIKPQISSAPWVLRVTEHKDKPIPVLIVKERIHPDQRTDVDQLVAPRSILKERGFIHAYPVNSQGSGT